MISIATDAAPGRPNEDFVIATPDLAIVVDGAGVPFGGCHHGVSWYAQQLGTQTLAALVGRPDVSLTDGLAAGITAVADLHRDTCDLGHPGTPCAAVAILRIGAETVDALALSDCTVVVETSDGPQVTCDLSIDTLCGSEPSTVAGLRFGTPEHAAALAVLVEHQTRTRNRPEGWWVAAADPEAAQYAQTASYPRAEVTRAAVLSDGATRPVDQMRIYDWPEYLDLIGKLGAAGIIEHVRSTEMTDPEGERYPRTKCHDDAAVAVWTQTD